MEWKCFKCTYNRIRGFTSNLHIRAQRLFFFVELLININYTNIWGNGNENKYAAQQIICLCIFLRCLTSRNNQARLDINWYITTKLWHWARLNPCKITPNRKNKKKNSFFPFVCACSNVPALCSTQPSVITRIIKQAKTREWKFNFLKQIFLFHSLQSYFPKKQT